MNGTFLIANVLLGFSTAFLVFKFADRLRMVDIPNERSLHSVPKPRGGGVGIALFALTGLSQGHGDWRIYFVIGALAVALVGWIDDSRGVSVKIRFLIHSLAAALFLFGLGMTPKLSIFEVELQGLWLYPIFFLFLVWMLNLYNFMDGADGFAGTQAVTAAFALGYVACSIGNYELGLIYLCIGAVSLGFLALNWPPAKIFMGDVGSGFLGFAFGALALFGEVSSQLSIVVFLIVFAYFIVDASLTLIHRSLRGAVIYQAHREHTYQKLIQSGLSHRQLVLGLLALNAIVLAPLAYLACHFPEWRSGILILVYGCIVLLCILARLGARKVGKATEHRN